MGERDSVHPLADASAVDVADAVLGALARRGSAALVVEPLGDEHALSLVDAEGDARGARLPAALGDAVVARLGVLAGVDPWAANERLGRLRLAAGPASGEFLLVARSSPRGLGAELRRLVVPVPLTGLERTETIGGEMVGEYRLEAELGRGGMGVVYRARRVGHDRPVAIKILHDSLRSDPELAAQFIREGRAASFANHPGIVNVTDFGTRPNGSAYLVMELVGGRTLDQELTRGALPLRRAVLIASRIAATLEAAHVRGVVHRDLKPSNVFLDEKDEVKIGDFGAAKVLTGGDGEMTRAGRVVGTPTYMSPEHARGWPTDERTDVYALGCVLFKMISGEVPFSGDSLMKVLFQHVSAPLPVLRSPFGAIPVALQDLVHRCLAKDPEARFQSAGELRRALREVLGQLPPAPDGEGG